MLSFQQTRHDVHFFPTKIVQSHKNPFIWITKFPPYFFPNKITNKRWTRSSSDLIQIRIKWRDEWKTAGSGLASLDALDSGGPQQPRGWGRGDQVDKKQTERRHFLSLFSPVPWTFPFFFWAPDKIKIFFFRTPKKNREREATGLCNEETLWRYQACTIGQDWGTQEMAAT